MHGAEYTPTEKVPSRNTANKFNGLEITGLTSEGFFATAEKGRGDEGDPVLGEPQGRGTRRCA